jgi:hypothetical protein
MISHWFYFNLKLELSEEKTFITELDSGAAKFLGYSFQKTKNKRVQKIEKTKLLTEED